MQKRIGMTDMEPNAKVIHLFRRVAMCSLPEQNVSFDRAIDQLFIDSENFLPLTLPPVSSYEKPMEEPSMGESVLAQKRKFDQEIERRRVRDLNTQWVGLMIGGKAILRERMSLFWHGHFACRTVIPVFAESYINTIRKHALGNFGEMLMAVSKEPAMLQYLNNQQNRKDSPNENFAREVMELFTMGRGNYTEQDVKEGARSFTGWAFNLKGEFQFREKNHDAGIKDFLGRQGAFDGTDIVRILLEKRETALFVTTKIYRSLVSENLNQKRIAKLADEFYKSNYDIGLLLRKIFTSDWFYDQSPQDELIKSPVELLVGMSRALGATFYNIHAAFSLQKILGQVLFNPPNVAGWPGGRSWIDSSSLLTRMQLPSMLLGGTESSVKGKESGDDNDPFKNRRAQNLKLNVDWEKWATQFDKVPIENLAHSIAYRLLARIPAKEILAYAGKVAVSEADRVQIVRSVTQRIMSLPEYQVV